MRVHFFYCQFFIILIALTSVPLDLAVGQQGSIRHEVHIQNNRFVQKELKIDKGDEVLFIWDNGAVGHNVAQVWASNSVNFNGTGFRSGSPQSGPSEWLLNSTLTQNDTILYYICEPHVITDNMRGKIIVGEGGPEITEETNIGVFWAIIIGVAVFSAGLFIYLARRTQQIKK